MDSFRRGLRSSLLLFRFSPGLAAAAIAALGMGIGFTTTMFSIVHGVTRPLPVPEPDRIVAVEKIRRGRTADLNIRAFDYDAWRGAAGFEALAAYENIALNLTRDGVEPQRVTGTAVTANTFDLLRQAPFAGRTLQPADEHAGATPVILLSHRFWQQQFAADATVVGTEVRMSGVPRRPSQSCRSARSGSRRVARRAGGHAASPAAAATKRATAA